MARQRRNLADQLADMSQLGRGARTISYTTPPLVGVGAANLEPDAVTANALADGAVSVDKLEQAVADSITQATADAASAVAAAGQAQTSANGKNKIYYTDTIPTGGSYAAGDTAFIRPAVGQPITAEYQWDGTAWQAVTLSHEVIASLDAGKITVGELDGIYIKAKSISAASLLLQGANLVESPQFASTASWSSSVAGPGSNWDTATVYNGAPRAWLMQQQPAGTPNMSLYAPLSNLIPVTAGSSYRVLSWVRPNGTLPAMSAEFCQQVYFFDATSTILAGSSGNMRAGNGVLTPAANIWNVIGGLVTAPAGAVYMKPRFTVYFAAGTTPNATTISIGQVSAVEAADGSLVVDGSILANHLSVGSVTAGKLETTLVLASDIIAGPPTGNHALMNANGFRVLSSIDGNAPTDVIRMGTDTDDYIGVVDSVTGDLVASVDSAGAIAAADVNIKNTLFLGGDDLGLHISGMPQSLATWAQVPINTGTMYLNSAAEIGLFELGWDANTGTSQDRMFELNLNDIIVSHASAGNVGIIFRYTVDGTAPTVASVPLAYAFKQVWGVGTTSIGLTRIIGSSNGDYIRVLVSLITNGPACSIPITGAQDTLFMTVKDLGVNPGPSGLASSGNGSHGSTGSGYTPPPVNPKVTTTKTWNVTSIRSFTGSGAYYAYNTSKMYSGLSPSGYGDLSSMAVFPSVTSYLSGATVNDVWIYVYYDFWYYGSGGNAAVSLHGESAPTASKPASMSFCQMSSGWPRAAGRWVRLNDSTYAGWKSGTWKGFALGGHGGGYTEYGYAHGAQLRIRYTK